MKHLRSVSMSILHLDSCGWVVGELSGIAYKNKPISHIIAHKDKMVPLFFSSRVPNTSYPLPHFCVVWSKNIERCSHKECAPYIKLFKFSKGSYKEISLDA